jgi:hypothetical protein
MTLILAVLTDEYVALASDRRVTERRDMRITRQEDTDTKTFNICGHFLMGFTGLARIDGHRIERWVVDVLAGVDTKDYFEVLREEIDSAFHRLGYAGLIPHAFLAVGFARVRPTDDLRPLSIVISNSLDQENRFSSGALGSDFKIHAEPLGNRRQQVLAVGWPVSDDDMATLDYRVRIAARGEPTNPALSLAPLVLALRATADRSQDHVGHSVLYASLPRKAVPAPYVSAGKPDARNQPISLFLPQRVRSARPSDIYAPAIVCPELSMIGLQISTQGPIGPTEGY